MLRKREKRREGKIKIRRSNLLRKGREGERGGEE